MGCLVISRVVGFGNPTPKLRPSGPRPSPRAPDGQDPARAVTWGATPASQTWANNVAPFFFFAEILLREGRIPCWWAGFCPSGARGEGRGPEGRNLGVGFPKCAPPRRRPRPARTAPVKLSPK